MSGAAPMGLLVSALAAAVAGCATPGGSPPADLAREYEHAIRESAVRTPASSVPLRAIPREQTVVTVATFTEWGAPATPLQRYTWVSLPDQLHQLCRGKPDPVLAIQEILGLRPAAAPSRPDHQWQVVTFTVPRQWIFRPCPGGTDISAPSCAAGDVSNTLDADTTRFLLRQLWTSDRVGFMRKGDDGRVTPDVGYPFTGMGWSYDWDPASPTHVGVSEYVLKPGAPLGDVKVTTPDRFGAAP
jgi:hypothetical protein